MAEENKNPKKSLFRQKSIETIESPEAMNEYLRVTSPGVWTLLAVVIVFLIGVCLWGIFGRIDSSSTVAVVADKDGCYCLIRDEDVLSAAIEDKTITIDGKNYDLAPDTLTPVQVTDDFNVYILIIGDLEIGDIVYNIPVNAELVEGVYEGSILTEQIRPMDFLFKSNDD